MLAGFQYREPSKVAHTSRAALHMSRAATSSCTHSLEAEGVRLAAGLTMPDN
jgi:hypothetical protein